MADFLWFAVGTAVLYFFSLACLAPLVGKNIESKELRIIIFCLVIIVFSLLNAYLLYNQLHTLSIEDIENAWKEYVEYCSDQHVSWNEFTFPEWASSQASYGI